VAADIARQLRLRLAATVAEPMPARISELLDQLTRVTTVTGTMAKVGPEPRKRPANKLRGTRVLIVEDEPLVALMLNDMLDALACEVVGRAMSVNEALEFANHTEFDIALLDVRLGSESSYAVARELAGRGQPFIFVTALSERGPEWSRHWPRLLKPFSEQTLKAMVLTALSVPRSPVTRHCRVRSSSIFSR
jgi:CheY-like chemotaxis protein